jgi:hypothetical protein
LDLDDLPIHLLPKHHLGEHHSCNGQGVFIVLKKFGVVNVLAHLYTPYLENGPFAMMQIGLVRNAMQPMAVMWEFLRNVAQFDVCLISKEVPWLCHVFSS